MIFANKAQNFMNFNKVTKLTANKNYTNSVFVTLGTIANSFLGLLFYLLAARFLGSAHFGELSFYLSIAVLVAEISDFGFSNALIKFAQATDFHAIFNVVFLQRILLLLVFVALAQVLRPFGQSFLLTALVASSLLFFSLLTSTLLGLQKYFLFVALNLISNLVRLALVAYLLTMSLTNESLWLLIFSLANFLGFLIGLGLIINHINIKPDVNSLKPTLMKILNFSGFLGGSFSLASLASKVDIPLVFLLSSSSNAGIYSAAQKLTMVVPQIQTSLDSVFAPKFSSGTDFKKDYKDYLKLSVFIFIVIALFLPLSPLVIPLLFSSQYVRSVPVFIIMALGMGAILISGAPNGALIYRLGKTKLKFYLSLALTATTLCLYIILIPRFGAMGAALSSLSANLITAILFFYYFQKHS